MIKFVKRQMINLILSLIADCYNYVGHELNDAW